MDQLKSINNEIVFIKANGEQLAMPNLTALVKLYHKTQCEEIKTRIVEILNQEIGALLVCEIMIDMQNDTTMKRLETGEISKTMRHVGTYNIILESHLDKAKMAFQALKESGEVEGDFEACVFATFPYGMVIEREKFPQYKNTDYSVEIL